ncbi:glycosyl transferase [Bacteroidia bacterium]|nr:glycosyl transferase [Bacteroidia bacterium]
MKNLVSIIIPCYNGEKFIAETLDSVRRQTYTQWECIIMDDGSTDHSAAIVKEYANQDHRFTYLIQNNQGVAIARNTAIKASHGIYILPLDADDLIDPHYIDEAVKVLDSQPEVKVVYCNAEKFGRKKGKWELPDYDFNLLLSRNLIFCSALFRRTDFDKTIGYNPNMSGMEDWDFWLSFLNKDDVVIRLPQTYLFYRTHRVSRNRQAMKQLEQIHQQIYLNHKELYINYIDNPIQVLKDYNKWKKKWFYGLLS